ncbi:MAG: hypothetical protein ACREDR_29050 [Blastocatellia bacterium]
MQAQQGSLAEIIPSRVDVLEIEPYEFDEGNLEPESAEGAIPLESLGSEMAAQDRPTVGDMQAEIEAGDLNLELAGIGLSLRTRILHVGFDREVGRFDLGFQIDDEATVAIQLLGEVVKGGCRFSARRASFRVCPINHAAAAEFVASSMTAALGLSDRTVLKAFGGNVRFGAFNLELREISDLIRNRETARRLMVIGKAFGYKFQFPPRLSGAEVQTIAFFHHAIVDRSFVWPMFRHPLSMTATKNNLEMLGTHSKPGRIGIPRLIIENLLGKKIDLGMVNILMEEAIIEDAERVLGEVSALDGHEVQTFVRSLAGRATIECPEAPTLPPNPWTPNEEGLMAIENELVTRITDRYNALAASTLEGLTEEQQAELTNPPGPTFAEILNSDQPMARRNQRRGRRRR